MSIFPKPTSIFNDSLFSTTNTNNIQTNNNKGSYTTWLNSVRVATTSEISLSDRSFVIDGVSINRGDRVLVKNQAGNINNLNGFLNNGIYVLENTLVRVPDFNTYTCPVGVVFYVEEGTINGQKFYNCTNNYSDIIGLSYIHFSQIFGIPGGPNNSVQYNSPLGTFSGSSSLEYINNANTLILGAAGYTSTISSGRENLREFQFASRSFRIISIFDALTIQSGSRGDVTGSTFTTSDGSILISTQDPDNLFPTTGNVTIMGTDVNFITGENARIHIKSGIPNITNSSNIQNTGFISITGSQINLYNNSTVTNINGPQITFTKSTVTSPNFSTVSINSKQGFITITDPSALLASSYTDLQINNNLVNGGLIFVNVDTYVGTGNPLVQVINSDTNGFTVRIYNSSVSAMSNSPMTISFIIF